MFKQSILSISAALMLSASAFADNAPLPILRSAIAVSGETISLADLMQGDNLPQSGVYASPAPGQTGIIKASRIVEMAKKVGIASVLGDVAGNVKTKLKPPSSNQSVRMVALNKLNSLSQRQMHPKAFLSKKMQRHNQQSQTLKSIQPICILPQA